MSKCGDCKYAEGSNYKISNIECCTCSLTRRIMNANADSDCNCFNRDLSEYDICYNCKYYGGGGDWGLFCSHEDMYHHLGKFSDEPCKRYERRTDDNKKSTEKRTETHACDLISRQAVIRWVKTECNPYGKPTIEFESGKRVMKHLEQMPSAQSETCEGCKHLGKWENEVEYGYPSPCTRCKRRAEDHYER